MNLRKFLSGTATLAAFVVGMAAFLAGQDTPYPVLENLTFAGWLALSAGIVTVIAFQGIIVYGLVIFLIWLPGFLARRLIPEGQTPPNPPAPAAATSADIDSEWADIEQQIEEEPK